eukprot:CAMPEP_0185691394 /NCGR_PEP_ID=MMETSP1164-20130828/1798_1 /TAXON_ID=1104430 /ORGANISM="Chrysoreinhardia sp, Strain CCMP2950" /LENGTH=71 /DNA_ID=CAMNT_0028358049 /DNA_START=108 /DNA_END=323 /DNA_ORIENTATION=-
MVAAVLNAMPLSHAFAYTFTAMCVGSGLWLQIQRALTASNLPSTYTDATWAEATVQYRKFQDQDPIKQIKL